MTIAQETINWVKSEGYKEPITVSHTILSLIIERFCDDRYGCTPEQVKGMKLALEKCLIHLQHFEQHVGLQEDIKQALTPLETTKEQTK